MNKSIPKNSEINEEELIKSIENDEWISARDRKEEIDIAKAYAQATMKKDKRMNIRISERDLRGLKIAALEEGLPYQTLVSMVLHRYLNSRSGSTKNGE